MHRCLFATLLAMGLFAGSVHAQETRTPDGAGELPPDECSVPACANEVTGSTKRLAEMIGAAEKPEPEKAGQTNRGSYPTARVTPEYPRGALERGISGCVTYGFTISAAGKTKDISVLSSSNSMFEGSGERAVAKFRYDPLIRDGVAFDDSDQSIRLVWKMSGAPLPDHPACHE